MDVQANAGETDVEVAQVCTKRTVDPTAVSSCAVFSKSDE